MKKLFFLAATAMLFAACSNEVAEGPNTPQAEPEAVGFDVYLPGATQSTRAGRVNVMNTTTLQMTGFGIFGYQTNDESTSSDPTYISGDLPNYMWNQQVFYNSTAAGWYYAPLKYWPNETKNDSQTPQAGMPSQDSKQYLDRLTFFAYAPWVSANQSTGVASVINSKIEATNPTGIYRITGKDGINISEVTAAADPRVTYVVATNPNQSVDLLWGVAPAGGLNYTAVNGTNVEVNEGMPLKNLTKPAVNTNMKFTFQHALARFGVKVVLAADQVAAGGNFDYGSSKVTIEKIDITGPFGTTGVLNLNNEHANIAKWKILATENLTIDATHGLAEHLRYEADKNPASGTKSQQTHTGVTTDYADALQVSSVEDARYNMYSVEEDAPDYSATRPYFSSATGNATSSYVAYNTWSADETNYTYVYKTIMNTGKAAYTKITPSVLYPNATVWKENTIYQIKNSAKFEVVASGATGQQVNFADASTYTNIYRLVNNTYIPTGQKAEVGDWILPAEGSANNFEAVPVPTLAAGNKLWKAKPNYFMVIPTQTTTEAPVATTDRTLKVKITYYVSTTDPNVADQVVYTKNEVEKDVVLPHLKNGVAYDLKLILGLTSVKVEAEVADWVTTEGVVNLPQNTSE